MFKSPFSFSGRIRRTEYGLSFLIYIAGVIFFSYSMTELVSQRNEGLRTILTLIIVIPALWFMLAQGVKRSHDLANSGWFILIPFYGFWLILADSNHGVNEYGPNPKGIGNDPEFAFEQGN